MKKFPPVKFYDVVSEFNKGILRTEIYFCRTSGVPGPEYRALMRGFQRILNETGRSLRICDFGNYNLGYVQYGSPDWYQEQALTKRDMGYGTQVSAHVIDSLLRSEPFQKQNPHFDVMIVDKDLTTSRDDPANNFIFGYGPYPNNIISVKRFIHWIEDPHLRQACLTIIGGHEFGHNLDLPDRNFNVGSEGYKWGHCNGEKDPCLMEQVNVEGARSIEEQTKLLFNRDKLLCPDCTEEINYKKDEFRRLGIPW